MNSLYATGTCLYQTIQNQALLDKIYKMGDVEQNIGKPSAIYHEKINETSISKMQQFY